MYDDGNLERLYPTPSAIDELGSNAAEKLLQLSKDYAPIRVDLAPPPELTEHFKLAKTAAIKFKNQGYASLSLEEQQALNAYVHLVTRPSLQTQDGKVRRVPDSWPLLESTRAVVNELLKGVGRLDRVEAGVRHRVATGWFVARDLIMTNNHVVAGLCEISPHQYPFDWRQRLAAAIDAFNARWRDDATTRPTWDPADRPTTAVTDAAGRVVHADLHPSLDMAVLQMDGIPSSERLAIPLSKEGPKHPEHCVYALGYPAVEVDGSLHPALVKFLFGTEESGMTKRVAPGQLLSIGVSPVGHDATTLGGSSGSPVIDFETHSAVGLHFSGRYGERNNAVPLWLHQDDRLFADHGFNFV